MLNIPENDVLAIISIDKHPGFTALKKIFSEEYRKQDLILKNNPVRSDDLKEDLVYRLGVLEGLMFLEHVAQQAKKQDIGSN